MPPPDFTTKQEWLNACLENFPNHQEFAMEIRLNFIWESCQAAYFAREWKPLLRDISTPFISLFSFYNARRDFSAFPRIQFAQYCLNKCFSVALPSAAYVTTQFLYEAFSDFFSPERAVLDRNKCSAIPLYQLADDLNEGNANEKLETAEQLVEELDLDIWSKSLTSITLSGFASYMLSSAGSSFFPSYTSGLQKVTETVGSLLGGRWADSADDSNNHVRPHND